MRYIVVLDARSPIGAIYAHGSSDGTVSDGELSHPALDCSEVGVDRGYYLWLKRDLARHGGSFQSLFVPHSCVVEILEYAVEEGTPIGFVAGTKT